MRIKELAQEARYIRHEEKKIKKSQKIQTPYWDGKYKSKWVDPDAKSREYWKLHEHRICDVRNAARAAQLAYAFLRGVPYSQVEKNTPLQNHLCNRVHIGYEIKRLVAKFWQKNDEEVEKWLTSDE